MNVKNIKGRTAFNSGQFLGYVLWKHSDGYHLRWSRKGSKTHNFQGKIIFDEKFIITKRVRFDTEIDTRVKNTIGWNAILQSHVDGFDFRTPGNFTVDLKIKEKKIKTKKILLGPNLTRPESNPFTIIQKIAEMKSEPAYEPTPKPESESERIYEPTSEPEPEPDKTEEKEEETSENESIEE